MDSAILFVAGPGRSGTTALSNYLNLHPEIALCRERYKFVVPQVVPDHFSFKNILGPREGETNIPERYDAKLLARKDPERLKWIGDKNPNYVRQMDILLENNPEARFIITYRPAEEVAESYEARANNPNDPWLTGADGFKVGLQAWNRAMRKTREFVEGGMDSRVLIVSYHDFFYRNEQCIPLIARFLGIEFDESIRESWREMSQSFEGKRRSKEPLTKEQETQIRQYKNHADEQWILGRIQRQWEELEVASLSADSTADLGGQSPGVHRIQAYERRISGLESDLEIERRKVRHLKRQVRSLKQQINNIQSSRSWQQLQRLARIRSRMRLTKPRRKK